MSPRATQLAALVITALMSWASLPAHAHHGYDADISIKLLPDKLVAHLLMATSYATEPASLSAQDGSGPLPLLRSSQQTEPTGRVTHSLEFPRPRSSPVTLKPVFTPHPDFSGRVQVWDMTHTHLQDAAPKLLDSMLGSKAGAFRFEFSTQPPAAPSPPTATTTSGKGKLPWWLLTLALPLLLFAIRTLQRSTSSAAALLLLLTLLHSPAHAQRAMENLGRGVLAQRTSSTAAHISWRMLGHEPRDVAYNLYRSTSGGSFIKLNASPLTTTTDYTDSSAPQASALSYHITPIIQGIEGSPSAPFTLSAGSAVARYISFPWQSPGDTGQYALWHAYPGDLDGDGEPEIIVKRGPNAPWVAGTYDYPGIKLQAYKLDGTLLWTVDLGVNIDPESWTAGAPVLVYDLDLDGKAEVIAKTGEGTKFADNNTIPDTDGDSITDYRNLNSTSYQVLTGPEFLSVIHGQTGAERARTPFITRGNVNDWGDGYGHRASFIFAGIGYLDGIRPSIIMSRGTGGFMKCWAWDFNGSSNSLSTRWQFFNNSSTTGINTAEAHAPRIGDFDRDGKDEFSPGGCTIDDNGSLLWDNETAHGDRFQITDFDIDRPGLEGFYIQQDNTTLLAAKYYDAATGTTLQNQWYPSIVDVGRGDAGDYYPNIPGLEYYSTLPGIWDARAQQISPDKPFPTLGIWWDGDLLREFILGANQSHTSVVINKFNTAAPASPSRLYSVYNDGVMIRDGGRPPYIGDFMGDWREEFICETSDRAHCRLFYTNVPATTRLPTMLHNAGYRTHATIKGYVNTNYPDYYCGADMPPPPRAPIWKGDLIWTGNAAANTWDTTTAHFHPSVASTSSTTFSNGKSVLFDLSGVSSTPVILSSVLSPSEVVIHSPLGRDYTLSGSGSLSGSMKLIKSGAGTATLTSSHSYTGSTAVQEGTLVISGSLTGTAITVEALGKLSGSGSTSQSVTLLPHSRIQPGSAALGSVGTLTTAALSIGPSTLNSTVTESGKTTLYFDLSSSPTGSNDRIQVNGSLTLAGTNTLQISPTSGTLAPGTYPLINYTGSLTGTASNFVIKGLTGLPVSIQVGGGAVNLIVATMRSAAPITWAGTGSTWDLNTSPHWLRSGSPDVFVTADSVTLDDTGAAQPSITINDTVAPTSLTLAGSTSYTLTGSGGLGGSSSLSLTGSGTLTLSTAANSFSGPISILSGVLSIPLVSDSGFIGPLGTGSSPISINGGTLRYTGGPSYTNRGITLGSSGGAIDVTTSSAVLSFAGSITGTGKLTKAGNGTLSIAGSNSYSGGTTIQGGTLLLGSETANSAGLGSGLVTLENGILQMTSDTGSYTNVGWNINVPAGKTGTLLYDDRCWWNGSLTGAGTFNFYTAWVRGEVAGNWSAFTGQINVTADADGGDFRLLNTNGFGTARLDLGPGVTTYYQPTMTGNLTFNAGALSGAATAVLLGGPGSTLTWRIGAANVDSTYAGTLAEQNATSTTALTKVGTSTLTLSGTCSHRGATTVSAGTLRLLGSITASSVSVASGARLSGSGSITGNVTLASGSTLALASSSSGNAGLTINGNLSLSGTISVTADMIGGSLSPGTHTIATISGTISGSPTWVWVQPPGVALDGSVAVVGSQVQLTLTIPPRSPGPVTWKGSTDSTWNSTTDNFDYFGEPVTFLPGDTVTFDDSGTATSPISIAATTEPAALIINTSTQSYTFNGTGALSGPMTLTKNGVTPLTISTAQAYTGNTTLNTGTLILGHTSALGTSLVQLSGGTLATGSLYVANTLHVTANSTITGGNGGGTHGIRNITGSQTLTLQCDSVFDLEGDMSAFSGTFQFTGTGSARFFNTVNNASALATWDLGTRTLTARGGNAFNLGALKGAAGSALGMASNNSSSSCTYTIGGNNTDSHFAGVIANGSASKPVHLIKTGSGKLTLSGTSTYTGNTTVSAGSLDITGSLAASTTTIAASGTLSGSGSIAGPVTAPGSLSPTGTLTLSAGLSLATTSVLNFDLGTSSDLISITGNHTLDGTLHVTAAPGFSGGTYTLISYSGTLTNNGLSLGSLPPGYTYSITTGSGLVRLVVTPTLTPFQQWQVTHFGSTTAPAAQPTADPDGDGMTNEQEFIAGTIPTTASSRFTIQQASTSSSDVALTFTTVIGKTYYIETSLDLSPGSWAVVSTVTATATTTSYSEPRTLARKFFRIRVQ